MEIGFSLYIHQIKELEFNYFKERLQIIKDAGLTRVFVSLFISKKHDAKLEEFYKYIIAMREAGFKLELDLLPEFLNDEILDKLQPYSLRLDYNYEDIEKDIAPLTQKYNVAMNGSMFTSNYIQEMARSTIAHSRISFCHNFYVRPYSGLSDKLFTQLNNQIHGHNYPVECFIGNKPKETGFTPNLLATLESHRNPEYGIIAQLQDCYIRGVDVVFLGNGMPTDNELAEIAIFKNCALAKTIAIPVKFTSKVPQSTKEYLKGTFQSRMDYSDYYVRSRDNRKFFNFFAHPGAEIKPQQNLNKFVNPGEIVVGNDTFGRYHGEISIALMKFPMAKELNLVGKALLPRHTLETIQTSNSKFCFVEY